jgi:hypothetical protein
VRKLLTWVVVTFGIAALVRWWRSRSASAPAPEALEGPAATATDPADELRQKLAESRGGEAPVADPGDASVEERRAEVHAEGRAAIDEMQSSQDDA